MRYIFVVLIALSSLYSFSQEKPEEIAEKFFILYESKGSDKAIDYIYSGNKWLKKNPNALKNLKIRLKKALSLIGNYNGYELVSKSYAGKSYAKYSYMLKYDRQPVQFNFVLYKPKDKWQIQTLNFDDKLIDDLKEKSTTENQ